MAKPAFRIFADGADVTAAIADRLVSLTVTDQAGRNADELTLRVDDRAPAIETPRKGAVLRCAMGYAGALAEMGSFTVDEVRFLLPPAQIEIRARSADLREGLKAEHTRVWKDTTIGAMAAAIAAEHGLQAGVAGPFQNVPVAYLAQTEESDLHLLTRVAKRYDAVAAVKNGRLLIVSRAASVSQSDKPLQAVNFTRGDFAQLDAVLPDRAKRGSVEAEWWSIPFAEAQIITAGEGEPVKRLRERFATPGEASAAAAAELDRLDRSGGEISFTVPGDVRLMAETPVTISGVRDGVDGAWSVTRAEHSIGRDFVTRIEAEAR